MKKFLLVLPLFFVFFVASAQTQDNCLELNYNLDLNSKDYFSGGEVTKLQNFLINQGYLKSEATGHFGVLTYNAVKDFQKKNSIDPNSGFVGPQTRAKIKSLSCDIARVIENDLSSDNTEISSEYVDPTSGIVSTIIPITQEQFIDTDPDSQLIAYQYQIKGPAKYVATTTDEYILISKNGLSVENVIVKIFKAKTMKGKPIFETKFLPEDLISASTTGESFSLSFNPNLVLKKSQKFYVQVLVGVGGNKDEAEITVSKINSKGYSVLPSHSIYTTVPSLPVELISYMWPYPYKNEKQQYYYVALNLKGFDTNYRVDNWVLEFDCDKNVKFGDMSKDGSDLCGTQKSFPASYYDFSHGLDHTLVDALVENSSKYYDRDVEVTLSAYDKKNRLINKHKLTVDLFSNYENKILRTHGELTNRKDVTVNGDTLRIYGSYGGEEQENAYFKAVIRREGFEWTTPLVWSHWNSLELRVGKYLQPGEYDLYVIKKIKGEEELESNVVKITVLESLNRIINISHEQRYQGLTEIHGRTYHIFDLILGGGTTKNRVAYWQISFNCSEGEVIRTGAVYNSTNQCEQKYYQISNDLSPTGSVYVPMFILNMMGSDVQMNIKAFDKNGNILDQIDIFGFSKG